MSNASQRAMIEAERSLAATSFDSTLQAIGTPLANSPAIMVFDNQTDVSVPLYIDGVLFKTFVEGDVFVLDLRANNGTAVNFGFDKGSLFQTDAAVGTSGSFRISTIYAG